MFEKCITFAMEPTWPRCSSHAKKTWSELLPAVRDKEIVATGVGHALVAAGNHIQQKPMHSDIEQILDILERARVRIESLEAEAIHQQARTNAVLLCLRDLCQTDPQQLAAAFKHYTEEAHQKLLEKIEDRDAAFAAMLDKRPPV